MSFAMFLRAGSISVFNRLALGVLWALGSVIGPAVLEGSEVVAVNTPTEHRDNFEIVVPRAIPSGSALVLSIVSAGNTGRGIEIVDSSGNTWETAKSTVFVTSRYHSVRYSILENGLSAGDTIRLQYDGTYYASELLELFEVADVSGVHRISSYSGYGSDAKLKTTTSAETVIVSSIHSFNSQSYVPGDYELAGESIGSNDALITEYNNLPAGTYKSGTWTGNLNKSQITIAFSRDVSNVPPVATSLVGLSLNEDLNVSLDLGLSATDAEDGLLAIALDNVEFRSGPSSGQLGWSGGTWRYTAMVDFNGADTFEYRVHDSKGLWSEWTPVGVVVSSLDDTPYAEVLAIDTPTGHRDYFEFTVPREIPSGSALVLSIASAGNTGRGIEIVDSSGNTWETAKSTVFVTSRYHSVRYSILENGLSAGDTIRLQYDGTYYASELLELFEVADVSGVHRISSYSGYGSAAQLETVTTAETVIVSSIHSFSSSDYSPGDYELAGEAIGGNDLLIIEFGEFPGGTYKSGTWTGSINSSQVTVAFSRDDLNATPVALDSSVDVSKDTPFSGQLLGSDLDDDVLTFSLVGPPRYGTLSLNSDGNFVYTPGAGFFGGDTFSFSVSDGISESAAASVAILVRPEAGDPDAPLSLTVDGLEFSSDALGAGGISKDVYFDTDSETWNLAWQNISGDSLHFVSTSIENDVRISVCVEELAPLEVQVAGGLRLGSNSSAFVSVYYTNDNKLVVESRFSDASDVVYTEYDWLTIPGYLRLDRRSDQIRCFVSEDGDSWRLVEERTAQLGEDCLGGLFLSSDTFSDISTGAFSGFSVDSVASDPFRSAYKVGEFGDLVSFTDVLESDIGVSFLIESLGGSLDWPFEDGSLTYTDRDGSYEIIVRIVDLLGGADEASAGLMFRDGLGEGAPFGAIYRSSDGALAFAYRDSIDARVEILGIVSASLPRYLRLSRAVEMLRAYHSDDGVVWEDVGAFDFSNTPFIQPIGGLFVSGLDDSIPMQALFDSVVLNEIADGPPDADRDGMSDEFEIANGLNPNDPSDGVIDLDSDGLSNLEEFELGTDPNLGDTDSDGLLDGEEFLAGLNPIVIDAYGDPDGDRYPSIYEVRHGSDPISASSVPVADLVVDSSGNGDYSTIQESLDSLSALDEYTIVLVRSGNYSEALQYDGDKRPLLISQFGSTSARVNSQGSGKVFDIRSPICVDGFTFTGGSGHGSGLYVWNAGVVLIRHCAVVENGDGISWGAVLVGYAELLLEDSIVSSNDMGGAGALWVYKNGKANLSHVTFVSNAGGGSDGIFITDSSGEVAASNSIFWSGDGSSHEFVGALAGVAVGHSFVRGGFVGDGVSSADPLVSWSGVLASGSPAIDTAYSSSSTYDSGLVVRVVPDVGGYEFVDSDSDGLSDLWELVYFGGLDESGDGDFDGDGLSNFEELVSDLDPLDEDFDSDGLLDGDELFSDGTHGDTDGAVTDPNNPDSDHDGLLDGEESINGLDPNAVDAYDDPDGDRYPSFYEIRRGSDPNASSSFPAADLVVSLDGLGDYATIQEALDAVESEAEYTIILVRPGVFFESLNYDGSKTPLLVSESGSVDTTIDAQGLGRVFDIRSPISVDGFTFTGGVGSGSGLYVWDAGRVYVRHCSISGNGDGSGAGAVYAGYSDLFLDDSLVSENNMTSAGLLRVYINGRVFLSHVTSLLNEGGSSDGIFVYDGTGVADVSNSILWDGDGTSPEFSGDTSGVVVRDSFVRGGFAGEGVSSVDPLLTPSGTVSPSSPAVDAAHGSKSKLDVALMVRGVPDIGAFEQLDSDLDGLPDSWELQHFGNLDASPSEDPDFDGLSNLEELRFQMDPHVGDSDGDGLLDGDELFGDGTHGDTDGYVTNPLDTDTDGDGMPDGWESEYGLAPFFDDSQGDFDDDGISNVDEYLSGTDPADLSEEPSIKIVSLTDPMGDLGPLEEVSVQVLDAEGIPLGGVPVEFFAIQGEHGVSAEPNALGRKSVVVLSDEEGIARAYLGQLEY